MKEEPNFSQDKQGRINSSLSAKKSLATMLDNDILEWFCDQPQTANGGNYQALINKVLREHIQHHKQLSQIEGKTRQELDNVFKILKIIAPRAVRNVKRLSLQNSTLKPLSKKWERVAFIGLFVSYTAFILAIFLLRSFKTIQVAVFVLVCTIFFMLFMAFYPLTIIAKNWKSLKNIIIEIQFFLKTLNQKNKKDFWQDAEYVQRLVKKLSIKANYSTLKNIKIDFEFSLKKLQANNQIFSSFLPILIVSITIFIIYTYGDPVQLLKKDKLDNAYNILNFMFGIVAPMLPIFNFLDKRSAESMTDEYNKCIFLLEKAQRISNNTDR